jgi:hypothetical protein
LQYPYIKKSYVESLLDYINYVKPDKLLCVGDELDCQTISTYARGTALEFEGSLQKNINGLKSLLKEFRSAVGRNKPFIMQRSNHTARIEKYIQNLSQHSQLLIAIKIENLLGYNDKELNITYNRSLKEFTKGWLFGTRRRKSSLFSQAGATALEFAAMKTNKSVLLTHASTRNFTTVIRIWRKSNNSNRCRSWSSLRC